MMKWRISLSRRTVAMFILGALLGCILSLVCTLVDGADRLQDLSGQLSGIVLTGIVGTISSLVTFAGLIVKGLVDNLTSKDEDNENS